MGPHASEPGQAATWGKPDRVQLPRKERTLNLERNKAEHAGLAEVRGKTAETNQPAAKSNAAEFRCHAFYEGQWLPAYLISVRASCWPHVTAALA